MSVIERHSSYYVRVHTSAGRYRYLGSFRFRDYGGKKQAKQAARKVELAAKTDSRALIAETCDSFAARWPDDYPRNSAVTAQDYRCMVKGFASDFAGVKLREVDRPTARRWALKQSEGKVARVRAMFSDAQRDGLVDYNPFSQLRLPRSRGRSDITPGWLTQGDVEELARIAERNEFDEDSFGDWGSQFAAWIVFQAFTGVRPGESRALEWSSFHGHELTINWGIDNRRRLAPPKTRAGRRTIYLPDRALEALGALLRFEEPVMVTDTNGRTRAMDLVFRGKAGGMLHTQRPWAQVLEVFRTRHREHELRTAYELRHYCATNLLERGVDGEDLLAHMGQADRRMIAVYGHPRSEFSRARIKAAWAQNVAPLTEIRKAADG